MRRLDYVILYVRDLETSIAFYRDVLGLPLKFSEHGYAEFATEGVRLGLYARVQLEEVLGIRAGDPGPDGEVAFLVDEVDPWVSRLRASGATVLSGPEDRPWGHRTLHVADPDGHVVELAEEIPRTRPRGIS